MSTHTDTKPSHILPSSQTPVNSTLTRQSSRVSLLSIKMCTIPLYTPPILHTLHSDTLVLTSLHTCQGQKHSLPGRRVIRPVHTHTQNNTSKSVLCPRLTPPTPQNKLCHIRVEVRMCFKYGFGIVLYVDLCPHTQTQNRQTFYLHHKHL